MRYLDEQDGADVNELAIHLKVSKLDYCQRYAEASAVEAHMKQGYPLAPGMEIGYVIRDARMWEVDSERSASEFDDAYNQGRRQIANHSHLWVHWRNYDIWYREENEDDHSSIDRTTYSKRTSWSPGATDQRG